MTTTTSTASYNYILDTGTVQADTAALLAQVQQEWITALGANLNTDASTSQGTLIATEVLARTSVMKNNAEMANMINPNLANGVYLDAICAFLGIGRGANSSTIAYGVPITGNAQTSIAAGSRVQSPNGDIFSIQTTTIIPSGGSTTVVLVSQAYGNIAVPTGTWEILDGTEGWGGVSVTSGVSVTPGSVQMTDGQLKNVRNQRLAAQGTGSSAAVQAAVLGVANVTSCQVVENNTGQTATPVNGITFTLPNAIWVCVAGAPVQAELAAALYAAHQAGCPWDAGATGMGTPVTTAVTDPSTGKTYNTTNTTPILYDGYVQITVAQNGSVSSPQNAVQNAIVNYATGQEQGEPGLIVGASLSCWEIGGAVCRQLPGMYVKSCQIAAVPHGNAAPTTFENEFVAAPYQQILLPIGNIVVTLA